MNKVCNECKVELPIDNFQKNRKKCKPCRKKIQHLYYINNKDRFKSTYVKKEIKKKPTGRPKKKIKDIENE